MLFDEWNGMKKQPPLLPSFWFCILIDLIGYASFVMPGLGEFSDLVWAPLSAFIFYKTFGGRFGATGAVLNFIEEALPFTDFIPSFTIAWFIRHREERKRLALKLVE
jgi:hypothetical protein